MLRLTILVEIVKVTFKIIVQRKKGKAKILIVFLQLKNLHIP